VAPHGAQSKGRNKQITIGFSFLRPPSRAQATPDAAPGPSEGPALNPALVHIYGVVDSLMSRVDKLGASVARAGPPPQSANSAAAAAALAALPPPPPPPAASTRTGPNGGIGLPQVAQMAAPATDALRSSVNPLAAHARASNAAQSPPPPLIALPHVPASAAAAAAHAAAFTSSLGISSPLQPSLVSAPVPLDALQSPPQQQPPSYGGVLRGIPGSPASRSQTVSHVALSAPGGSLTLPGPYAIEQRAATGSAYAASVSRRPSVVEANAGLLLQMPGNYNHEGR